MKNQISVSKDYGLWTLMQQVVNVIQNAQRKRIEPYGVTVEEFTILFVVQAIEKPVTLSKIAHRLCREPNSVSMLLERMVKRGLVRRNRDLEDRRFVRVTVTEKGQRIFDRVREEGKDEATLVSIFSSLSEDDRQQLETLLRVLRERAFDELGIEWRSPFP